MDQQIEWEAMATALQGLIEGVPQEIKLLYKKGHPSIVVEQAELLIVEGRVIFTQPKILELIDMKIFLDTDPDIMLSRKIHLQLQKRALEDIIDEYLNKDKAFLETVVTPQKVLADLVIFNFQQEQISTKKFKGENYVLQMILDLLKNRLKSFEYESRLINDKMSLLNRF